ncbi:Target of rapamycin [Diplonema papillatum]|nr:Target of rapamycin [Diplonema papillatum]
MEAHAMSESSPEQIRLHQRVINAKLQRLSKSPDKAVRYACIKTVDALLGVDYADSSSKTIQLSFFANFLSHLLSTTDVTQVDLAARAMGHIVQSDYTLRQDIVTSECNRCLEWLDSRQEDRYYSAVVEFTEIATAAPGFIQARLPEFRSALWGGLGHPRYEYRKACSHAFGKVWDVDTADTHDQHDDEFLRRCAGLMKSENRNPRLLHGVLLTLNLFVEKKKYSAAAHSAELYHDICNRALAITQPSHTPYNRIAAVNLLCVLALHDETTCREYMARAILACIELANYSGGKRQGALQNMGSHNRVNSAETASDMGLGNAETASHASQADRESAAPAVPAAAAAATTARSKRIGIRTSMNSVASSLHLGRSWGEKAGAAGNAAHPAAGAGGGAPQLGNPDSGGSSNKAAASYNNGNGAGCQRLHSSANNNANDAATERSSVSATPPLNSLEKTASPMLLRSAFGSDRDLYNEQDDLNDDAVSCMTPVFPADAGAPQHPQHTPRVFGSVVFYQIRQKAFSALSSLLELADDDVLSQMVPDVCKNVTRSLVTDPPCLGAAACVVALVKRDIADTVRLDSLKQEFLQAVSSLPLGPALTTLVLDMGAVCEELSESLKLIMTNRIDDHLSAQDSSGEGCTVALCALSVLCEQSKPAPCAVSLTSTPTSAAAREQLLAQATAARGHSGKKLTLVDWRRLATSALPLLQHEKAAVRQEAALACVSLISLSANAEAEYADPAGIAQLFEEVLTVALSDPSADVRLATLRAILTIAPLAHRLLRRNEKYLKYLSAALVDEVSDAREVALAIIGPLVDQSTLIVDRLCSLARLVTTELQCRVDSAQQEQAARMLGNLAKASPAVLRLCGKGLPDLLINRLDETRNVRLKAALLNTLCLLLQSDQEFTQQQLATMQELAVKTLSVQSSGATAPACRLLAHLLRKGSIEKFIRSYPNAISRLHECLREDDFERRVSVMQLLGVTGALDHSALGLRGDQNSGNIAIKATASDFDAHVACRALLTILEQPSLAFHRRSAVQALQSVLRALPSIPRARPSVLLARVLPSLLDLLHKCLEQQNRDTVLIDALFRVLWHATAMVDPANDATREVRTENKAVVARYSKRIIEYMKQFWDPTFQQETVTLISLSENLHQHLGAMEGHVQWLMPCLIELVHRGYQDSFLAMRAVSSFVSFCDLVAPFLIPVASSLLDIAGATDQPPEARTKCIQTLAELCTRGIPINDVSARVIHTLVRICQGVVTPAADARHGVGNEALRTLCVVAKAMGRDFDMFRRSVVLSLKHIRGSQKAEIAVRILNGELPLAVFPDQSLVSDSVVGKQSRDRDGSGTKKGDASRLQSHDVNNDVLRNAVSSFTAAHTVSDYTMWFETLALDLLEQSPRTVLRSCANVARSYLPLCRGLFPPAFAFCYNTVNEELQTIMAKAVRTVLEDPAARCVASPMLNLAVFVERAYAQHFADAGQQQKPVYKFLPPDRLWRLALAAQNYPLALYWLEAEVYRIEKDTAPAEPSSWPDGVRATYLETCRRVVHAYKCLELPYQAEGVLQLIKRRGVADSVTGAETYEALGWWGRAYDQYYKACLASEEKDWPYQIAGMMRCMEHMGDWRGVLALSEKLADKYTNAVKVRTSRAVSHAAFMLSKWDTMESAVKLMPQPGEGTARHPGDSPPGCTAALYRAILAIRSGDWQAALRLTAECRTKGLEKIIGEHVQVAGRGYELLVTLQHLCEVEEIALYFGISTQPERQAEMRTVWTERLRLMKHDAWHMKDSLMLRSLAAPQDEMIDAWLHYVDILDSNRAARTLKTLLGGDTSSGSPRMETDVAASTANPRLVLAYLQHMWDVEPLERPGLLDQLQRFLRHLRSKNSADGADVIRDLLVLTAQWKQITSPNDFWTFESRSDILANVKKAIDLASDGSCSNGAEYRIHHEWALLNLRIAHRDESLSLLESGVFAIAAARGFVKCIELCDPPELATPDMLRLLRLLFSFGGLKEVEAVFRSSFKTLVPKHWVPVLPQIVARIGSSTSKSDEGSLGGMIHDLLTTIAATFPQSVLFAVTVPLRCATAPNDHVGKLRKKRASLVYTDVRALQPELAEEVDMMTSELVRVAVLWAEKWCEGLLEANRLWMLGDVPTMVTVLAPLHDEIQFPTTKMDEQFLALYQKELDTAKASWVSWQHTKHQSDLARAWVYYGQVYARLCAQLRMQKVINLVDASPALSNISGMNVEVPGTNKEGSAAAARITISKFSPTLNVMGSKRRPKQLAATGSDGKEYLFLLKGQEDLRLDQRVMQILSLVNTLIRFKAGRVPDSPIPLVVTFSVVPLSSTAGLIGWVEKAQTMDRVIMEMRGSNAKRVREELDLFTDLQCGLAGTMTLMQKVEVLEQTLQRTASDDIHMMLWLRSSDAAQWISRRTVFTRSNAMMSMVGYILGLGDRHPGNVMFGAEGKVVHIDFADCFESAMLRDMFPEKVPFRLTNMMVRAMGVGAVSGTFLRTACTGMSILRRGKHSLMAMMEAFVYDPIVTWRLTVPAEGEEEDTSKEMQDSALQVDDEPRQTLSSCIKSYRIPTVEGNGNSSSKVKRVIKRIQAKLDGTDFAARPAAEATAEPQAVLDVSVHLAIAEADIRL